MSRHFRISRPCYERLLAVAVRGERLEAILKSGGMVNNKVEIVCADDDAEVLLETIIMVCPEEAIADPVE